MDYQVMAWESAIKELSTLVNSLLCCWQAEEARDHCKACQIDVGEKRVEMANTKSDIITQIREMVSQCDLTLKAVSVDLPPDMMLFIIVTGVNYGWVNAFCFYFQVTVNWFQLQQAQVVSLPVNNQSLCENAKLYEPGQRYIEFVRNLHTDGPRLESHSFDSAVIQNTGLDLAFFHLLQ